VVAHRNSKKMSDGGADAERVVALVVTHPPAPTTAPALARRPPAAIARRSRGADKRPLVGNRSASEARYRRRAPRLRGASR
jgi:hypothetical protein